MVWYCSFIYEDFIWGFLQKLSVEGLGAKLNWQTLTYISIILNTCETKRHGVQAGGPVICQFEMSWCTSWRSCDMPVWNVMVYKLAVLWYASLKCHGLQAGSPVICQFEMSWCTSWRSCDMPVWNVMVYKLAVLWYASLKSVHVVPHQNLNQVTTELTHWGRGHLNCLNAHSQGI